jgi:IMP cyclohydrolase
VDAAQIAKDTFKNHLENNTYPGRGLVVGRADDGEHWIILYFIMGRSPNSRNRRFASDGDRLWTEPLDESKVEDPSLIIYDAMLALPGRQIVSNGDQTRTVLDALLGGGRFASALATREREPDAPNYTPRITALLDLRGAAPAVELAILKANRADPAGTDRFFYRPAPPPPGLGYGLTTYQGDGAPLPPFEGDPRLLPVEGRPEDVLEAYWKALDAENRIALAVKATDASGEMDILSIRNAYD